MTDRLLQLSSNPQMRQWIQRLGLPLPLPVPLQRQKGPQTPRPFAAATISVGGLSENTEAIALGLARAGATMDVAAIDDDARGPFQQASEAFAQPLSLELVEGERPDALVFDASAFESPEDFRQLHDFFHPRVRGLGRCGRVVVLGPAPLASTAMVCDGLEGFVKRLAKEIGRKGSTANLLLVPKGVGGHIDGALRFLLSPRSAFVTGQRLVLAASRGAPVESFERGLDGRVALITGAARGIGAATAEVLVREGAKVFCLDRPGDDALAKTCARIGAEALELDITSEDAADQIAAAVGERGVDIVVHNAGVTRDRTLAKMKAENWDLVLSVNLAAVIRVTEKLAADKVLRSGGRVVGLSSVSGIAGNVGQTNYAASKGGLSGWVRGNASALGRRRITLNAIAPGFIETRMTAAMPTAVREAARRLSALGQGGQPVDVAEAVAFLASPEAAPISGQVLRVCGGAFVGA